MSPGAPLRLFLDSNVLTAGIVSSWGLDKAVLSLCAARICRLVLADIVREEVEENLLAHATSFAPHEAEQLVNDYLTLLKLVRPITVRLPDVSLIAQSRHPIRHAADVPVLLSALQSKPDSLLTHNTAPFTPAVAKRTGLRIGTPYAFFHSLAGSLT